MSAEGSRRGGCLDRLVTVVTGGNYGVETVIVYFNGYESPKLKKGDPVLEKVITLETVIDNNLPVIQRRIVKTPKSVTK